jgi:ATP adenylyltransferase
MEKPLWAPWRMEYILSKKPKECIFCEFPAAAEADDRKNLVVHRSAHAFTCLNRYPYNSGHGW